MQARARVESQPEHNPMDTMSSLREDVCALAADLQKVVRENRQLRHQLDRLRQSGETERELSDLRQVKREVDELSGLYERAHSSRSHRTRFRSQRDPGRRPERSRLREMMLMMIMSELI